MPEPESDGTEVPVSPISAAQVDELCASTIRAISGDSTLRFRARVLHRGQNILPFLAPHLYTSDTDSDFMSRRGAADSMAWRIALSDPELHTQAMPEDPIAAILFEMLEQYRVESLGAEKLLGCRNNMGVRFQSWSAQCEESGLLETGHGLLVFYVAQVGRSVLMREPVSDHFGDLLESTRGALSHVLGSQFSQLRKTRHSQVEFTVPALAIANEVGRMLTTGNNLTRQDPGASVRARIPGLLVITPAMINVEQTNEDNGGIARGRQVTARSNYEIFTTAYDRELAISDVITPATAVELRSQLDELVAKRAVEVRRLARAFGYLLSHPEPDAWNGGHEEGLLDGRRLTNLVLPSTDGRIFREQTVTPIPAASVTILIDCSGSMKKHREKIAVMIDLHTRALDLAGVQCEVLGFTTNAWNGGRARADWVRAGRPAHPGRMNEILHVVIKDVDTSWRRARRNIASLLAPSLYREGIDGEAVAWAHRRLMQREAHRRIMLVIADGSPADSATNLVNDEAYINRNLFSVVANIEDSAQTQLSAMYFATEMPASFRVSRMIDPVTATDAQTLRTALELLVSHR